MEDKNKSKPGSKADHEEEYPPGDSSLASQRSMECLSLRLDPLSPMCSQNIRGPHDHAAA